MAGATVSTTPEPALLGPVSRPGTETLLIVVAAVSFQAFAWAILIWLLRADGPWYHFFDVSDIVVYLDYAQKVSQGLRVYKDFSFEYPPLALPLFTLPPHGDPAAYPNWFAAEMILLGSAAAALTGATAAALWRGLRWRFSKVEVVHCLIFMLHRLLFWTAVGREEGELPLLAGEGWGEVKP